MDFVAQWTHVYIRYTHYEPMLDIIHCRGGYFDPKLETQAIKYLTECQFSDDGKTQVYVGIIHKIMLVAYLSPRQVGLHLFGPH